jgi:hypothetical protein
VLSRKSCAGTRRLGIESSGTTATRASTRPPAALCELSDVASGRGLPRHGSGARTTRQTPVRASSQPIRTGLVPSSARRLLVDRCGRPGLPATAAKQPSTPNGARLCTGTRAKPRILLSAPSSGRTSHRGATIQSQQAPSRQRRPYSQPHPRGNKPNAARNIGLNWAPSACRCGREGEGHASFASRVRPGEFAIYAPPAKCSPLWRRWPKRGVDRGAGRG